jgi:hypothetical protein
MAKLRDQILILDTVVGPLLCTEYAPGGDGYLCVRNPSINGYAIFDPVALTVEYRKVSIDVICIVYSGPWPEGLSALTPLSTIFETIKPERGYYYGYHE